MRFMPPAFPNVDPPIDTLAQVNRVKKSALLLPLPVSKYYYILFMLLEFNEDSCLIQIIGLP